MRAHRLRALLLLVLAGSLACALLPSTAAPDASGKARSVFPRFDSAVPVLLYHRLVPGNDGYSVAPASFDAQMRRLHDLGFDTITLGEYVRFVRGEPVDLPQRPILVTFDDGYSSSWETADPVLARYGWSAVMYTITGAVGRPGYLTWDELRRMQASGRWQIEEHAGDGHVLITADDAGRQLPFYASELSSNGRKESFSHYRERVSGDIEHGAAMLARNLLGWTPNLSFAVPFNDYGQNGSNDSRIEPWLTSYLKTQFTVVFVQRDGTFTTPGPGFANRITVSSRWDADTLETHLLEGVDLLKPAVGTRGSARHSSRSLSAGART